MGRAYIEKDQKERSAHDYMTGLLLVIQDMKQRTNKLEEESDKLTKNLVALKDSKNIDSSALYLYLTQLVSGYHLADINFGFIEKRINNLMERLEASA